MKETKNKKGPLFILSIVFFVIGLLISCLNAYVSAIQDSSNNISYILGYSIGSVLLAIGLFLLATKVIKKKGVLVVLSILYLLVSFSTLAVNANNSIKRTQMNKAAVSKLVSIYNNISAGQDVSKETFDKSMYGDLTPILNIVRDYGTKSRELSTNMTDEISAADFGNLLSPDTLSNTDKINAAKIKIKDSKEFFDKYEADYKDLVSNLDSSISSTELPKTFKSSFIDGFRNAQVENQTNTGNFFNVERDILSKANEILDYMNSIQGNYIVQNKQLLFKTNADLDKYNQYIRDIQKLATKEADIQKTIRDSAKIKLDKLDNFK